MILRFRCETRKFEYKILQLAGADLNSASAISGAISSGSWNGCNSSTFRNRNENPAWENAAESLYDANMMAFEFSRIQQYEEIGQLLIKEYTRRRREGGAGR